MKLWICIVRLPKNSLLRRIHAITSKFFILKKNIFVNFNIFFPNFNIFFIQSTEKNAQFSEPALGPNYIIHG